MTSIQRLEVFNKAFNEYKIAKNNYIIELDKAYSPDSFSKIINNHTYNDGYIASESNNIVKTGDGIAMSNQSNNLFDNTISGDNYYYSNMKYQGDGIYSNTFVLGWFRH